MAYYRLYYFNTLSNITSFEDAELANDEAAVEFARGNHRGSRSELWNEGRRVATLEAGQYDDQAEQEPTVSLAR